MYDIESPYLWKFDEYIEYSLARICETLLSRSFALAALFVGVAISMVQASDNPETLYLAQAEPESADSTMCDDRPVVYVCDEMDIPLFWLNSRRGIGRFIEGEIISSYRKNGFVDWESLVRNFESAAENTSVIVLEGGGLDGADVYRFTVDKTNGFWGIVARVFPAPGGPNGKFTAIVRRAGDGQVAIIESGGIPKWLKLE